MNTITMGTYRPSQKLHPLSLLAQMSSRQASGCLQVSSGTTVWSLYLEQGKLIFASTSVDPFGRLDRHLRRLNATIPSLISAVRVQLRLLFETSLDNDKAPIGRDYQAICWLVEQQHLSAAEASLLIEDLAKEVLESFLVIQNGNHDLIEQDYLSEFPKFCHLDLRALVEHCQVQLRQRQTTGQNLGQPFGQPMGQPIGQPIGQPSSQPTSTPTSNPLLNGNASPKPDLSSLSRTPASTPAPTSAPKTSYTIACIDDSPTVLQAINSFLDDKSFSVIMISDPVKALMQIIRSKPDLILLDVTMPNLDGYELCSLLRKHPHFRHTPIVMVTGNTGFIDRAKAKLVGASGYLTKPFTQSDLVKMVFKHLS